MTRVVWLTDIHLERLEPAVLENFCMGILDNDPDVVLISGDIAEAPTVTGYLQQLNDCLQRPIYFVLGNHDFYYGSFAGVRADIANFVPQTEWLTWLSDEDVVELAPGTGLVGHDGWADGRLGDYANAPVNRIGDYRRIDDLIGLDSQTRLATLNTLGDEAADHLRRVLPQALATYQHVIVLTHVPPFGEATNSCGKPWQSHFLPHFTCKVMGDALLEAKNRFPHRRLTVLCGHAHGGGEAHICDNLHVITGSARYRHPEIKRVFDDL